MLRWNMPFHYIWNKWECYWKKKRGGWVTKTRSRLSRVRTLLKIHRCPSAHLVETVSSLQGCRSLSAKLALAPTGNQGALWNKLFLFVCLVGLRQPHCSPGWPQTLGAPSSLHLPNVGLTGTEYHTPLEIHFVNLQNKSGNSPSHSKKN